MDILHPVSRTPSDIIFAVFYGIGVYHKYSVGVGSNSLDYLAFTTMIILNEILKQKTLFIYVITIIHIIAVFSRSHVCLKRLMR